MGRHPKRVEANRVAKQRFCRIKVAAMSQEHGEIEHRLDGADSRIDATESLLLGDGDHGLIGSNRLVRPAQVIQDDGVAKVQFKVVVGNQSIRMPAFRRRFGECTGICTARATSPQVFRGFRRGSLPVPFRISATLAVRTFACWSSDRSVLGTVGSRCSSECKQVGSMGPCQSPGDRSSLLTSVLRRESVPALSYPNRPIDKSR